MKVYYQNNKLPNFPMRKISAGIYEFGSQKINIIIENNEFKGIIRRKILVKSEIYDFIELIKFLEINDRKEENILNDSSVLTPIRNIKLANKSINTVIDKNMNKRRNLTPNVKK